MDKSCACIILFEDDGRVLIQHRTDDAPTYPAKYGLFGGRVEAGEKPLDAAKRECYEELEYELEDPKLILTTFHECKYGKREKFIFIEKYDENKKLVLHEGQGFAWIDENNIDNFDILEHDLIDLKRALKIIKKYL